MVLNTLEKACADNSNRYSENSFTITPTRDATVSFNFYGTAVGFYGSKKPDQGVFRVSIDGRPSNPENATVSEEVYNVSLFTASNLPKGEHNVVLQNTGGRWRDLDYVRFLAYVICTPG